MGTIELDKDELCIEIISKLDKEKHMVLATCSDERITARMMCYVNIGVDVYFQTDKNFLKVEQIIKNPKVALCMGNMQIEGTAELLGHPGDLENSKFSGLFKERHPQSYDAYTALKDEMVIKVKPSLVTLWKYAEGKPCREFLYLNSVTAFREYYEPNR